MGQQPYEFCLYPATEQQKKKIPSESYESGGGRRIQQDGPNRSRTQRLQMDSRDLVSCEVCKGLYKKRGLKIHQTKSGCSKRIPHRRCKSEATSTQDTNHSDASCRVEFATTPFVGVKSKGKEKKNQSKKVIKGQIKNMRQQEAVLDVHINNELYEDIQELLTEKTKGKKRPENTPDIRNWFKGTESSKKKTDILQNTKSSTRADQIPKEIIRTVELTEENFNRLGKGTVDITKCSVSETKQKDERYIVEESTRPAIFSHSEDEENTRSIEISQTVDLVNIFPGEEQDNRTVEYKDVHEEKGVVDLTNISPDTQRYERTVKQQAPYEEKDGCLSTEEDERTVHQKESQEENDVREVIYKKVETMRKVVDIRRGNRDDVISKHGYHLKRRDYRSLSGRNYLNDRIIDQYLKHIEERNQTDSNLPKVYASTTFLYTKLELRGIDDGMKETRNWFQEDLRENKLIFFPIHKLNHWSLIVVDTATKVINYLDSLEGSRINSSAPRTIKTFMERYYRERGEETVFKIKIRQDAPLQENGVDCGVFVCQYAERTARSSPLNFRQSDLRGAREKMTEELLEGKIGQVWQRWRAQDTRESTTSKARLKWNKGKEKQERRGKDVEKSYLEQKHIKTDVNDKTSGNNGKKNAAKTEQENQPEKKPGDPSKGDKARKEKLKWPKSNSPEWRRVDDDLTSYLKILISSPEKKAETHPFLIYNICRERFGIMEIRKKQSSPALRGDKGNAKN